MSRASRGVITVSANDGEVLSNFESVTISESFTDPLGSYRFVVTPSASELPELLAKLDRGNLVAIKLNGNPLATPIITTRETRGSATGGIKLDITCKSVLCTPYEGSSDPDMAKKWKEDVAVDTVLMDQLQLYGFSEVFMSQVAHANAITGIPIGGTKAPPNVKALKLKELQGQETETAYQLCSRVFSRLGVALHVDWQGALMLVKPDFDQQSAYALVQDTNFSHNGDRILDEWTVHESNDGLYSEVVVRGQAPDNDGDTVTALPVSRLGISDTNRPDGAPYSKVPLAPLKYTKHVYKSTVAPYKPRFVLDKDCRDAERCRNMAHAIYGSRTKDAFWIECSVGGFISTTGRAWAPNTMADVYIEALDLQERMWILERTFEQSRSQQMTRLKLLPRGAIVLDSKD